MITQMRFHKMITNTFVYSAKWSERSHLIRRHNNE